MRQAPCVAISHFTQPALRHLEHEHERRHAGRMTSESALVDVATGVPAHGLRGLVDQYVGYQLSGFPPGVHRGLPSRHLTFIISLGPPIEVLADAGTSSTSFAAVLSGFHSGPALIRHNGEDYGIALELTPAGARRLFGLPAGALASTIIEPEDVVGAAGRHLQDRLAAAKSWKQRFEILDYTLTAWARSNDIGPQLIAAWDLLMETSGACSVDELAAEVGWSRRHLSRKFQIEFGLAPKTAARMVRFDRARQLLAAGAGISLADIAHAAGYFDQAHFTRDFREFAGCSPTRWIAEEFPFVQDHAST